MSAVAEHTHADLSPEDRLDSVRDLIKGFRSTLLPLIPDVKLRDSIVKKIDNISESSLRAVLQHKR